jgi:hypothetical protein
MGKRNPLRLTKKRIMKKIIVLIPIVLFSVLGYSQTLGEITKVVSDSVKSRPAINSAGNFHPAYDGTSWVMPAIESPSQNTATLTTKILSGQVVNGSSTDSLIGFDPITKAYTKVAKSSVGAIFDSTLTQSKSLTLAQLAYKLDKSAYLIDSVTMLAKRDTAKLADGIRASISRGGNIVAMTPISAVPETVISFDGLQMKWHQSATGTYDGIAIRTTSDTRSMRYTSVEFYTGTAAADGGKTLWGSTNAWYNLPAAGATATIINATYPYAQNVTTTFLGIGNPALPNSDTRIIFLYDITNGVTYKIYTDKQASTGEVQTAQNGTCAIIVEKLGTSTNTILTGGTGIAISNGVVNSTWTTSGTNISNNNTGNVGIGTTTPTSTLDNAGSFGQRLTTTALAAYTATATDNIIMLTLAGTQTLTLPAASTCLGRTYRVKNPTKFMKVLSPTYTSNDGTTGFSHILEGEDVEFISTGTVWQKVGGFDDHVIKSIYMANGSWNTKTISLGGVEFQINGITSGAGRVLTARTTDGTTKSLTQNCTRTISGSGVTGEAPSNSVVPTTYTALHTATTDIAGNYYKTILDITNRATTVGSDNWIVTVENDGSIGLLIRVQYTKSR